MRIFKNTWFTRFAKKEGITDTELRETVNRLEKVIHQDAEGLHKLGIINDKEMQEYDQGCLIKEQKTSYAAEKSPKTEYAASSH